MISTLRRRPTQWLTRLLQQRSPIHSIIHTGVKKSPQITAYIIARQIICANPAWRVFLSAGQRSKIDAFFKRAHKYNGFTNRSLTVNELLNTSAADLYQKAKYPTHCLHMLFPPKKSISLRKEAIH